MQMLRQREHSAESGLIRILHVEDNFLDRELVRRLLEAEGIDCQIMAVQTKEEFVRNLAPDAWDLILSDYALPTFDGLNALELAKEVCPNTPFVFFTGTMGEDRAVESLKCGATDYVLKQKMVRLGASVRRALRDGQERLRREAAEANLVKTEERLRFLAFHDPLTDLPNRAFLLERLKQVLSEAIRRKEKAAVLFVDLDHFKAVNDSLGHPAGDAVLRRAAEQLTKYARSNDFVARLGGDEFVVVLGTVADSTDAAIAADRIKRGMGLDFDVNGTILSISCTIGISLFPDDGDDAEALLKNADAALFCAKEAGRNQWQFFTPEMNGRALERLKTQTALRQAVAKQQFFLEYQPQLDIKTGRIIGAEALLRWRHPEEGVIPPSKFISIAESCGEIIPIGEWALRTACNQARQWHAEGIGPLVMAVNVSAVQFGQESFLSFTEDVLRETGLAAEFLELEVTESVLLSNADVMASAMFKLSKIGAGLAIDDFGTGYCGFSYLRQFQFSRLKIDGSFVHALATDPREVSLTTAIINMGKTLNMKMIAECVETEAQLEILRSLGCDQVQGYYFDRPLGASAFAEKFRANHASLPN
jgi:diguanylate cyclase (GGDEF)-like protein